MPVLGLTESALASACLLGHRFSIIAISQRIQAWYREVVEANGLVGRLASIRALAPGKAVRGSFAPPPVKPNRGLPDAIARLLAGPTPAQR